MMVLKLQMIDMSLPLVSASKSDGDFDDRTHHHQVVSFKTRESLDSCLPRDLWSLVVRNLVSIVKTIVKDIIIEIIFYHYHLDAGACVSFKLPVMERAPNAIPTHLKNKGSIHFSDFYFTIYEIFCTLATWFCLPSQTVIFLFNNGLWMKWVPKFLWSSFIHATDHKEQRIIMNNWPCHQRQGSRQDEDNRLTSQTPGRKNF